MSVLVAGSAIRTKTVDAEKASRKRHSEKNKEAK